MPGQSRVVIHIRNEYSGSFRLAFKEIRLNAQRILKEAGSGHQELSLLIVGDRRMRTLNRQFLNHDWTTDVISFDYSDHTRMDFSGMISTGEIIISVDTAKRLACELRHSVRYEFYFYLCHGILHLAGYNDDTPRKRTAMLKKQADILQEIGINKG